MEFINICGYNVMSTETPWGCWLCWQGTCNVPLPAKNIGDFGTDNGCSLHSITQILFSHQKLEHRVIWPTCKFTEKTKASEKWGTSSEAFVV
jgi:hypothetical protein